MKIFIGTGETARRLGCARTTVARLAALGTLPAVGKIEGNLGGFVFDPETVREFAESRSKA